MHTWYLLVGVGIPIRQFLRSQRPEGFWVAEGIMAESMAANEVASANPNTVVVVRCPGASPPGRFAALVLSLFVRVIINEYSLTSIN